MFGLQFATALGASAIVNSSSDEKLARAARLGGSYYRAPPIVMKATVGEGARHILELGGPGTYDRCLRSVASGGKIIQI